MKTLIICYSYHHGNTQKVAEVMAKVLDAETKAPQQTNREDLKNYYARFFLIVAFSLTISSTCFSISPDIQNHLNIELKITNKKEKVFESFVNVCIYASFLLPCPGEAAKTSVTFIMPTLFIFIFEVSILFFAKLSKIGPLVWKPLNVPFSW